mgnify:CR=1 FL=1
MRKKRRGFRGYMARTFKVSEWISRDFLLQGAHNIRDTYRLLVQTRPQGRVETFTEAIVRLRLTEKDIYKQQHYFRMTSSLYLFFLFIALVYFSWMLVSKRSIQAVAMVLLYSSLMGAFFFRESFWYMQIRTRRLGQSFNDWCRFILSGGLL